MERTLSSLAGAAVGYGLFAELHGSPPAVFEVARLAGRRPPPQGSWQTRRELAKATAAASSRHVPVPSPFPAVPVGPCYLPAGEAAASESFP